MRIIEYFRQNQKLYGTKTAIKKVLQRGLQRIVGVDHLEARIQRQQDELDTLFYFLNEYVDIKHVPAAKGELRNVQDNDVELLLIFDTICRNNNLVYWLSWGTLLGAVRHKGFIPWDDDLDVQMAREDYEKAKELLKHTLEPLGFKVWINPQGFSESFGIAYNDSGVWIDVYPLDRMVSNLKYDDFCKDVKEKLSGYYAEIQQKHLSTEQAQKKLAQMIADNYRAGAETYYVRHLPKSTSAYALVYRENEIFPVKQDLFEGKTVMLPNEPAMVLERMFGHDYMKFPRRGVFHHQLNLPEEGIVQKQGKELADVLKSMKN